MTSTLSKVVLVGATGTVGKEILDVLLEDSTDNFDITILSRLDSTADFSHLPSDKIDIKHADYTDLTSLTSIFSDKDAIIHASAIPSLGTQKLMIEAAVNAGVQRFIVNEYANSYENQPGLLQELERFRDVKREILKFAKEKAEESGGRFSWSALATGNMLDLSLKRYPVLGIDIRQRKARLVDGGVEPFTAVVMRDIGVAVRGMLRNPEATRDKFCHIRSVETSQGELLDVSRELVGGEWEVKDESGEEMYQRGKEAFAKGERSGQLDLLVSQLFKKGMGRSIVVTRDKSDNELLGVQEKTAREVVEGVLPYFELA